MDKPLRTPFDENDQSIALEARETRRQVNAVLLSWHRMANLDMSLYRLTVYRRLVPDIIMVQRGIEQFFIIPENLPRLLAHFEQELAAAKKRVSEIEKALNRVGKLMCCPMCNTELTEENLSRLEPGAGPRHDHAARLDSEGRPWCRSCTEIHDAIDWDKMAEDRLGRGE